MFAAAVMGGDRTQVRLRAIMRPVATYLRESVRPLIETHDVALLDLDGVVYVGADAVPGARQALAAVRASGMRLAFVTNNAARPPRAVADHLTELGIAAQAAEVVTSAQAAARYLADRLPEGARVLVVGTSGLYEALHERGLNPVPDARGPIDAVVQGYSPDLDWRLLAEGAVAINRGVLWVATNLDPTVPSPRGPLPGNGSLVAALRHATGVEPVATGKPDPAMHRESVLRSKAERPIVVGDRLDTDIEGAAAAGCPSLLVLTGVTMARDLLMASPRLRPTYLARDVSGLLDEHPEPRARDRGFVCGSWYAIVDAEGEHPAVALAARNDASSSTAALDEDSDGPTERGDLDALRALCAAWWAHSDRRPHGSRSGPPVVRPHSGAATDGDVDLAQAVVRRLGLG